MTLPVILAVFVATGLVFGLVTFTRRHLFSEGHTRPGAGTDADPMQSRLAWTVMCAVLWPLMALSGAFSWWVRRGR